MPVHWYRPREGCGNIFLCLLIVAVQREGDTYFRFGSFVVFAVADDSDISDFIIICRIDLGNLAKSPLSSDVVIILDNDNVIKSDVFSCMCQHRHGTMLGKKSLCHRCQKFSTILWINSTRFRRLFVSLKGLCGTVELARPNNRSSALSSHRHLDLRYSNRPLIYEICDLKEYSLQFNIGQGCITNCLLSCCFTWFY